MSIEAMKQALEALEHHGGHLPWNAFVEVRKDLRTAIQQAEAKTGEPVLYIHPSTFEMNNAHVGAWKPGHELPGYIPLFTHPAPGAPDDVVRDAERYRWLRDRDHWPAPFASSQDPEPVRGIDLDAAIDAAIAKATGEEK